MDAKKRVMKVISRKYNESCLRAYFISDNQKALIFLLGLSMVVFGSPENAHAGSGTYGQACNKLLGLIEGAFGALVAAAAGVAAIIAAALGGFKMAWSLVVVAIGSFVLRSFISLFNGVCQ
jgi:type IV secretory pathway VirB2 component (pilin)